MNTIIGFMCPQCHKVQSRYTSVRVQSHFHEATMSNERYVNVDFCNHCRKRLPIGQNLQPIYQNTQMNLII